MQLNYLRNHHNESDFDYYVLSIHYKFNNRKNNSFIEYYQENKNKWNFKERCIKNNEVTMKDI